MLENVISLGLPLHQMGPFEACLTSRETRSAEQKFLEEAQSIKLHRRLPPYKLYKPYWALGGGGDVYFGDQFLRLLDKN